MEELTIQSKHTPFIKYVLSLVDSEYTPVPGEYNRPVPMPGVVVTMRQVVVHDPIEEAEQRFLLRVLELKNPSFAKCTTLCHQLFRKSTLLESEQCARSAVEELEDRVQQAVSYALQVKGEFQAHLCDREHALAEHGELFPEPEK